MKLDEYQEQSEATALYPGKGEALGLSYAVLGLAGEAGELANQCKKVIRDDDLLLAESRKAKMQSELGDVLWYLAAVARELNISLSDVAEANLSKLRKRAEQGTIKGDGEDRSAPCRLH